MSADLIASLKEALHRRGGKLELLETAKRMAESVRESTVKESPKYLLAGRVESLANDMKTIIERGNRQPTVAVRNNVVPPSASASGSTGNSAVPPSTQPFDLVGNYLLQMPRNDEVILLNLLKKVQFAPDWKAHVTRFIQQKNGERYYRPGVKTSFIEKLRVDNDIKPSQLIQELESKIKSRQRGGRRTRRRTRRNHKRQSRVTRGR